ncbi:MAG: copper chaperone PCu(A)C [Pseudomonadota bacterium]
MARLFVCFGLILLSLTGCGQGEPDELTIKDGYIRLPSPNAPMAAAYFVVRGPEADRLVAAEVEGIGTTELHTVEETADGVMKMRPVASYDLPAGGSLRLEPGGNHLMLMAISQPLEAGQMRKATLRFESGAEAVVDLEVKGLRNHSGQHDHH